jgi:hypothetical protein
MVNLGRQFDAQSILSCDGKHPKTVSKMGISLGALGVWLHNKKPPYMGVNKYLNRYI